MEQDQTLSSLSQMGQNQQVRMGQCESGKRSRKANSRTRRKRWKRRKNRRKRAHHPNARFLGWFPSISNVLLIVECLWLNVLTVAGPVRSLHARACFDSHHTNGAKCRPLLLPSGGRLREKRTGMWS